MVKVDGEIQLKTVVRRKFGPFVTIFNPDWLFDADKFLRRIQFFDACIHQQINKGGSATIHNRNFWRVHFHHDVIDAQTRKCCVQVFDCRNTHVMLINQASTEHGITHGFGISREIYRWIQVSATIDDPGISRRGAQRQRDFFAGM